jgi:arylsulfatase A-like enzyme
MLAAASLAQPANVKLDGVNLLPFLAGEETGDPHDALFWRYANQSAVRMGDWKLLQMGKQVRLYNLKVDLGERTDLAADEPEKVKELAAAYEAWNATTPSGGHRRRAVNKATGSDSVLRKK